MENVYKELSRNYSNIRSAWKMGNMSYEMYQLAKHARELYPDEEEHGDDY